MLALGSIGIRWSWHLSMRTVKCRIESIDEPKWYAPCCLMAAARISSTHVLRMAYTHDFPHARIFWTTASQHLCTCLDTPASAVCSDGTRSICLGSRWYLSCRRARIAWPYRAVPCPHRLAVPCCAVPACAPACGCVQLKASVACPLGCAWAQAI